MMNISSASCALVTWPWINLSARDAHSYTMETKWFEVTPECFMLNLIGAHQCKLVTYSSLILTSE